MTGPSTSPSATGQRGLVTDEMVRSFYRILRDDDRHPDSYALLRAALCAVAPDIAAQARRECAEELLQAVAGGYVPVQMARLLASRWSGSGRTPADEG